MIWAKPKSASYGERDQSCSTMDGSGADLPRRTRRQGPAPARSARSGPPPPTAPAGFPSGLAAFNCLRSASQCRRGPPPAHTRTWRDSWVLQPGHCTPLSFERSLGLSASLKWGAAPSSSRSDPATADRPCIPSPSRRNRFAQGSCQGRGCSRFSGQTAFTAVNATLARLSHRLYCKVINEGQERLVQIPYGLRFPQGVPPIDKAHGDPSTFYP